MMIGIYFKFHRFWSVRNLDLIGLIAFSPALLLVYYGLLNDISNLIRAGYVWLFAVSGFFLVRLLLDPVMVRRPLLEPNLSASGLTFTGMSLLVFLMANVITSPPERLERLLAQQETAGGSRTPDTAVLPVLQLLEPGVRVDQSQPEAYRQAVIRSGSQPGGDDSGASGGGGGHGVDWLSPFRQHPHRRGRGHALPALFLHQPVHQPDGSRRAGDAAGVGRGGLSPAGDCGHPAWAWPAA